MVLGGGVVEDVEESEEQRRLPRPWRPLHELKPRRAIVSAARDACERRPLVFVEAALAVEPLHVPLALGPARVVDGRGSVGAVGGGGGEEAPEQRRLELTVKLVERLPLTPR